jgi:hypothetical protein
MEVDAVDQFGGGLVAFAFDVHDLAADHAGRDCAADTGANGERELAEDLDDGGGWRGE